MCGIVGGFSIKPIELLNEPNRLEQAIDSLAHRGPDDRGRHISADGCAFLGHRRLSIIDLSGGHQPIADESGQRLLCYNGEIYNYRELRKQLQDRGHRFATHTDGEAVLHLYEEDAQAFAERLEGMFAVAILDEAAGRLTLLRDRHGIKPLYYYLDEKQHMLLFASEIKAILSLLPRPPAICSPALRQYLRWKYIPEPLTIFENIYKLPPAHLLVAACEPGAERISLQRSAYWQLDYGGDKLSDERQALAVLDEKLRAAVLSHLESDVEVGALLSGGVDSSLVVALAASLSSRPIKTFTVGFEEAGFDQLPFARIVAKKYGTQHYEEHVTLDPLAVMPRLVRQFDEPFGDSSALACYRVCQVASEHVKVALTGDGGDETFAGYGRYEEVLRSASDKTRWPTALCRAIVASSEALFSPEAKFLKRQRAMLRQPLRQHEEHQVMFSPWLSRRLLTEEYQDARPDLDLFGEYRRFGLDRRWAPIDIAQYVDLRMYLPGDILTKVDRTSMACSLECRVPLLDHSITEFSTRLAADLKVRAGVRKYLLKRLAERYVPPEVLYRPKMGFRVPIRRWFKRELLRQTRSLLLEGKLVSERIIEPSGLRWMFRMQQRPWIDFGSHLWALLFLEYWAQAYLD